RVKRVAVLRNPALASGGGQLGAIQTAAPSLGVDLRPVDVREASEIERGLGAFALSSNAGLIVPPNTFADLHPPPSHSLPEPAAGVLPVPLLCHERRSRLLRS